MKKYFIVILTLQTFYTSLTGMDRMSSTTTPDTDITAARDSLIALFKENNSFIPRSFHYTQFTDDELTTSGKTPQEHFEQLVALAENRTVFIEGDRQILGTKEELLFHATFNANLFLTKTLLTLYQNKLDVNKPSKTLCAAGFCPIHFAIQDPEILKCLMAIPSINLTQENKQGQTALTLARSPEYQAARTLLVAKLSQEPFDFKTYFDPN